MQFRTYIMIGLLASVAVIGGHQASQNSTVYAVSRQRPTTPSPQTPAKPAQEEDPVALTPRPTSDVPAPLPPVGPDQFGSFFSPQINNRGDVAFLGRYTAPKAPAGFGQAIFIKTANGQWKFVRDTDQAANIKETGFVFGPFSFNDQAEIAVTAAYGRKPVLHASSETGTLTQGNERNSGIFFTKSASGFVNLTSLGQEVPNMPSRFSSFSNPSMNSKGTIAFVAAYIDPDGRGLFLSEEGKLRIVARSGQRIVPGEPAIFSEHYYPSHINERGEVAFLSRVGVGAGIFVLRSTGIETIAMDGKPSPVAGTKYLGFGNRTPAINDKGEVVFSAFYDGPNAGRALFYKGTGPARLILTSSNKTQKHKFTDLMTPEINNRGDIAFTARLDGRTYGIFLKTAQGIEQIAITGDLAQGMKPGEEFNNFAHQPSLNDRGELVFYAQLKNASVGIFIKDAKGLRALVVRGEKLPF